MYASSGARIRRPPAAARAREWTTRGGERYTVRERALSSPPLVSRRVGAHLANQKSLLIESILGKASMSDTNGRLVSVDENGAMHSPS